uniref:HNH endonuclease n=1 Tax=viral metagenome TaxID=1070528 RepID=A0A6C0JLE0_9ZZZZ
MESKNLFVDLSKPEKKKTKNERTEKEKMVETTIKIPKKRVITSTDKWSSNINITPEKQYQYVLQIINKNIEDKKECELVLQQIGQKIGGYKGQDINKNLYSEKDFVDLPKVLELMKKCENKCFYCKKMVQVLYENVREPRQWTLERIDNDFGHNKTNIEIACLDCNLHRRTMYHERYLFTKELNIIKKT